MFHRLRRDRGLVDGLGLSSPRETREFRSGQATAGYTLAGMAWLRRPSARLACEVIMATRVIPWPNNSMTADLSEALDAVDLLEEALIQALDDRLPTGLQIAALTVVAGLRDKHRR
jgi:hypothetical protein